MKKRKAKLSARDRKTVENLLASAIAEFLCVGAGLPGFGSAEAAEESLLEVLQIDPENLEACNLLAQYYSQTRRHKEAWSYFLRGIDAAKKADDAVKLTCALAEIYEDRKSYRRAIRVYREALARHEDPELHAGLGYCLSKVSQFEESVRHFRQAVNLAPNDAKMLNDLGYSLIEMGELEEAESTLSRAVELDPEYELARNNLEHCRKLLEESRR